MQGHKINQEGVKILISNLNSLPDRHNFCCCCPVPIYIIIQSIILIIKEMDMITTIDNQVLCITIILIYLQYPSLTIITIDMDNITIDVND